MIDAIFVPAGAEARAVGAGLNGASSGITLFPIPMGSPGARERVAHVLRGCAIQQALVTGVCGLLAPDFRPGDALLYAQVRTQTDAFVPTDRTLTASLAASLPHVKTEVRALTWSSIVTTAHEKAHLGQRYGTAAVDMESYAVVTALHAAGVRTAVLRIASDGVNDDLPDMNAALSDGGRALNTGALVREMLRFPRAGITMMWNGAIALSGLQRAIARIVHATGS